MQGEMLSLRKRLTCCEAGAQSHGSPSEIARLPNGGEQMGRCLDVLLKLSATTLLGARFPTRDTSSESKPDGPKRRTNGAATAVALGVALVLAAMLVDLF